MWIIHLVNNFAYHFSSLASRIIISFIFSYKLGDSMATALATPFYLDLGYSKTEIGLIASTAAPSRRHSASTSGSNLWV